MLEIGTIFVYFYPFVREKYTLKIGAGATNRYLQVLKLKKNI